LRAALRCTHVAEQAEFIVPGVPTKTDKLPSGSPSLTFTLLARQLHQMPGFVDEE